MYPGDSFDCSKLLNRVEPITQTRPEEKTKTKRDKKEKMEKKEKREKRDKFVKLVQPLQQPERRRRSGCCLLELRRPTIP